jgi:ribosomal protein L7Ae-like RNA K-turn-binding protein
VGWPQSANLIERTVSTRKIAQGYENIRETVQSGDPKLPMIASSANSRLRQRSRPDRVAK